MIPERRFAVPLMLAALALAPPASAQEASSDPAASEAPASTPSSEVGSNRRIPLGAYGEAHYVRQAGEAEANMRRFVLFAGHAFNDWARFYSELEFEDGGHEVAVEQAYLELAKSKRIGLRAGLVALPLGILNLYHEPPTFNGVDRPLVDRVIIPTTWRELGVGVFGQVVDGVHYQLYLVNGLDAARFSPTTGIRPARGQGIEAQADDGAVTGRVSTNRLLGVDVGAGFYAGGAGQRTEALDGVRVAIAEVDGRFSRWGLDLRAEYARVFISGAARVTDFLRATNPSSPAIPSALQGFYAEAGYDVLRPFRIRDQQLVSFVRYEDVDTRAELPDVPNPGDATAQEFVTAGLTYRPHPQIVFKMDHRWTVAGRVAGDDSTADRLSFGIGFMY